MHEHPNDSTVMTCFDVVMGRTAIPALHTHGYHEFYCMDAGAGVQLVPEGTLPMERGDFFLFPAGCRHISNADNNAQLKGLVIYIGDATIHNISGYDEGAYRFIKGLIAAANEGEYRIQLSPQGRQTVRELFTNMIEEQKQRLPGYAIALRALMQKLFLSIMRDPGIPARLAKFLPHRAGVKERLAGVVDYIESNYMGRIQVEHMADIAHISRSHFHAIFKREIGMSLMQYVNQRRTEKAAQLLRGTDAPIIIIASQCGFPCLSQFYHIFRQCTGMTPKQARRDNLTPI